jgi:benzoate/toluate 1,2-dioxygenase subunit alpha
VTPEYLEGLVDDRPDARTFRVHRRVFTDPELFELEMRFIWERTWLFVGLESQIPRPHDFLTTQLGRHPLIVMRDGEGKLGCFVNSCRHKGALVCHLRAGSARMHVCRYHGWSYDSSGKNRLVKSHGQGAYGAAFDAESHDLARVPRFESYRGLLFASMNPDVPPLTEHLGDARALLDLVLDQSEAGIELIPGVVTYTYGANWKLQLENCGDGYHFTSTHPSYLRIVERRVQDPANAGTQTAWDASRPWDSDQAMLGTFGFSNGHSVVWSSQLSLRGLPLAERLSEIVARVGEARAKWIFTTRNLTIFPNLQLAENASSQLRIIRPLAVDRTEMTTFCIGPVGESREARRLRIRQYEDFFNPSGLATPDDTVTYEDCQQGYGASQPEWLQGYQRGIEAVRPGADRYAAELQISPTHSVHGPFELYDETLFHSAYRTWRRLLLEGLSREGGV